MRIQHKSLDFLNAVLITFYIALFASVFCYCPLISIRSSVCPPGVISENPYFNIPSKFLEDTIVKDRDKIST